MKVCHITTFWPNRFGHTHYTDNLIRGMRTHSPERHFIAAEGNSEKTETEAYTCVPCFSRREDYADQVAAQVKSFRADVALVQFTDDLFGFDRRFIRLLEKLKAAGVTTVVNTHNVYPVFRLINTTPWFTTGAYDRSWCSLASCVSVHSVRMRQDLIARGVPAEKIVVIPHGTAIKDPPVKSECRERLGISPAAKLVVFFGFLWPGKGIDFLLDVMARVSRLEPRALLYVAGHIRHKKWYYQLYMNYLRTRVRLLQIDRRVKFFGDYVPEELVPTFYGAADVVALPYRQSYSSVSGVVHQAAGFGRLMLCSRIIKFEEIAEGISPELLLPPGSRTAWAEALARLFGNERRAKQLLERVRQFAARTSWERVGDMHLRLYRGLAEGKLPAEIPLSAD